MNRRLIYTGKTTEDVFSICSEKLNACKKALSNCSRWNAFLGILLVVLIAFGAWAFFAWNSLNLSDHFAPVSIKSTNRHWRFFSPHIFGLAGPAGLSAGAADRNVISVSQQQRDEDLAQSNWKKANNYKYAKVGYRPAGIWE